MTQILSWSINDAKEESVNTILEMAQLKTEGKCKALLVTGCLAERYREEIETEIPEVDAILGTNSYDAIVNAVNEALKGKRCAQDPHDPFFFPYVLRSYHPRAGSAYPDNDSLCCCA